MNPRCLKQSTIILLLSFFILSCFFSFVQATTFDEQSENLTDKNPVFELQDGVVQKNKKFIVPSDKSISFKDNQQQIQISLPKGADIIDYSENDIEIVYENFDLDTINMSESQKLFIPFNYGSIIQGTQKYTFKIYFNETFAEEITNINSFNNYTIDWGNNEIETGNNIPSTINHTYEKPGSYNITINLIDKNGITYSRVTNKNFTISTSQYVTFWALENKEPLTFTTTAMFGSIIFFGIAFTETGKYKLLALLLLSFPLITQSQKEDVLDQFVRGQIYGYIKTHPGTHYNELMRELDIKNGTLSYHLYVLEKTRLIKSRKEHIRYRAFYPTEMSFPEEERYRLTDLQVNILKMINQNKGTNQKQIAKKLQEKHQTISYNIKVLEQAGLIYVYKKGRKSQCYLNKDATEDLSIFQNAHGLDG